LAEEDKKMLLAAGLDSQKKKYQRGENRRKYTEQSEVTQKNTSTEGGQKKNPLYSTTGRVTLSAATLAKDRVFED